MAREGEGRGEERAGREGGGSRGGGEGDGWARVVGEGERTAAGGIGWVWDEEDWGRKG